MFSSYNECLKESLGIRSFGKVVINDGGTPAVRKYPGETRLEGRFIIEYEIEE
jgi:hypothetical protein